MLDIKYGLIRLDCASKRVIEFYTYLSDIGVVI